ncbi:SMAD/FHA domain-containing protein [Didymella exigua CBS 183.55]|uniref:SMAD/FHA domain-containing protein n=1 Tax=Didymella exigua CBS 183.55 TaxID=1150837 RepID=A0A6A5S0Z6_9PLEO|nr:SMAD/FHA domain-containing protein [Didymella exigua CBS 183.55]KAF1933270.1 SMAD/FHA domain-containing protein [Didymella exigua CBS 183.55]
MTRARAETAAPQLTVRPSPSPRATPSSTPRPTEHDSSSDNAAEGATPQKHLPSIRFIPHQDPRAARPSLQFPTITRTLPDESAVVRVGRYSERDNAPDMPANVPSAAAIGFKSKVVSRKHCELWCKDGSWYIKDVKSSSGTFLNHIRLSQPNVESKPFRIKDGDIIQLGIDFRGGEEMIFRCVKIRVECNRGWQQGLNSFNKQTHQRLRNLTKAKKEDDSASTHTSECAICLMSIAPCQSLFVAPCSHVWHYKCIRPILNGATWPNFLCPNCRAVADLDADVEDPGEFEDWDEDPQANGDLSADAQPPSEDRHVTPRASAAPLNGAAAETPHTDLADLQHAITNISIHESTNISIHASTANPQTPFRPIEPATASVTQPVSIDRGPGGFNGLSPLYLASHEGLMPDRAQDGPMTPRNDAGPFVLDGSAGRAGGGRLRDESPASGETDAPSIPPVRFE